MSHLGLFYTRTMAHQNEARIVVHVDTIRLSLRRFTYAIVGSNESARDVALNDNVELFEFILVLIQSKTDLDAAIRWKQICTQTNMQTCRNVRNGASRWI